MIDTVPEIDMETGPEMNMKAESAVEMMIEKEKAGRSNVFPKLSGPCWRARGETKQIK